MPFAPAGNEEIALSGKLYRVRSLGVHGALATKALRMLGGHAQVFQLIDLQDGTPYALKVMLPMFRSPRLMRNRELLANLSPIPGFDACRQVYFTPQSHSEDLERYPDLAYASLMPWISGTTWTSIVGLDSETEIDQHMSWELAYQLLVLARVLERNKLAHCDLSGGNVIVDLDGCKVTLIDFDEVYWPHAPQPALEPTGTPGYRKGTKSQYRLAGDRFATAVLVAEMLGWREEAVRSKSSGDSYFTDEDCSKADSERYRLLEEFLEELHPDLGDLFRRAWEAPSIDACPTIDEWRMAVMLGRGWRTMPLDPRDRIRIALPPPVEEDETTPPVAEEPGQAPPDEGPVSGAGARQSAEGVISKGSLPARNGQAPSNPGRGRRKVATFLALAALVLGAIVLGLLLGLNM